MTFQGAVFRNRMLGVALGCFLAWGAVSVPCLLAQTEIPEWCRSLPRQEYKNLRHVPLNNSWFEVYEVAPAVFAIYEPHQSEETISYLIVGSKRAMLFDTGLGIGDLRAVTAQLTRLPIVVLNSHTHDDHVGDNWQFDKVYSMDTAFSRKSARGSRDDAQDEIKAGEICGALPSGFDRNAYATRPWKISAWIHDGSRIDLGGVRSKSLPHRVTRQMPSRCSIGVTGCFSQEILTIPARYGFIAPKPISPPIASRFDV